MTGKHMHASRARDSVGIESNDVAPTMAVPAPEQLVGLAQSLSERFATQMPQV